MDNPLPESATPEDRVSNWLEAEEAPPVQELPETPEPEAQEEPAEEPETNEAPEVEVENDEELDEGEPDETWQITVDGEELEFTSDQIVELAQKGQDYTRKTQRVADERRDVESAQEKIGKAAKDLKAQKEAFENEMQLKNELFDQSSQLKGIEAQLAEYEKVDWNALSDQDFQLYQTHRNKFSDLKDAKNELTNTMQQKYQEVNNMTQQQMMQQAQEAEAILKKDIGWNSELQSSLNKYISDHGLGEETIVNADMIKLIHKAYQFDQLKDGKEIVKNKVKKLPKVVKQGRKSPPKKATESQKTRKRLAEKGDWRDAKLLIDDLLG